MSPFLSCTVEYQGFVHSLRSFSLCRLNMCSIPPSLSRRDFYRCKLLYYSTDSLISPLYLSHEKMQFTACTSVVEAANCRRAARAGIWPSCSGRAHSFDAWFDASGKPPPPLHLHLHPAAFALHCLQATQKTCLSCLCYVTWTMLPPHCQPRRKRCRRPPCRIQKC